MRRWSGSDRTPKATLCTPRLELGEHHELVSRPFDDLLSQVAYEGEIRTAECDRPLQKTCFPRGSGTR